jgi:hypothetical protein
MANAGLLQILAQGPQVSGVERFQQGQQRGLQLADILDAQNARQFLPGAIQGDKGALAQLLGLSPEIGMQVSRTLEAAADRDEDRAWRKTTFDADQQYKKDYLGVLQQRADQAGTGSTLRGTLTDAGGRRVLINPQTGETIRDLGVSPSAVPKPRGPLNASMLKLKRESENNLVDIGSTRENLKSALALVGTEKQPGDVMSGFAPETRAFIGNSLPDMLVPDQIASPKGSLATKNYANIMNLESIQRMANTLKGATTDFELNEFVKILSDPTAPNSVKRTTIERMLKLADAQEALEQGRLAEFNGETPQSEQGAVDDQQDATDTYQGNIDAALQDANDAIAAGADKAAVMQRFREMFPDAEIE